MFKRFMLWGLMNIAVVVSISIIMNLLGVKPYLTAYGLDYVSLAIFCAIWGMVGSFISLAMSKFMAKRMMGVQILDPQTDTTGLVQRVHRFAQAAGLPKMPEVGIYNSPEVNAFATGPSKSNSLVAVSTGLLDTMNQEEADGVLAHEVAHIANGDMVTMALVQGVINAFVMFLARVAAFALQQAMRSDDEEAPVGHTWQYMLTTFAFELLFGFIGMFVISAFSRFREYRADAGGAKLAGRSAMINALKKLQSQYEHGVFDKSSENMNAMKISSKESGLRALLSTHPKLSDRIRRLEMSV